MEKKCKKCGRNLPMNSDYYFRNKRISDGYENKCKECFGKNFTDKLTNFPKDGFQICSKCNKELELNKKYFSTKYDNVNGYKGFCRECEGLEFLNKIKPSKFKWTSELEELLIEKHFIMKHSDICKMDEFKKLTPKHISDKLLRLRKKNPNLNLYKLKSHEDLEYYKFSEEQIEFLKRHYKDYTKEEILKIDIFKDVSLSQLSGKVNYLDLYQTKETRERAYIQGGLKRQGRPQYIITQEIKDKLSKSASERGYWKGDSNPRHITPLNGELNGRWKGGRTPLYFELRTQINEWKKNSMIFSKYKCFITEENFDNIHHIHPFKNIVEEMFYNTKLEVKHSVSDYSEEEFEILVDEIRRLHEVYGFGICLSREIHKDFHDKYGYTKNTKEQFIEYCKIYHSVDFKERYDYLLSKMER